MLVNPLKPLTNWGKTQSSNCLWNWSGNLFVMCASQSQVDYLCDQGLQKPLHSQGANFKTLGVPFQQDGGGGGRHGLC